MMKPLVRSNSRSSVGSGIPRARGSLVVSSPTTGSASGDIDSLRSLLKDSSDLRAELQQRDARVQELEQLVIELQVGAAENTALRDTQTALTHKQALVEALSADLEATQRQNDEYKRQAADLRSQFDSVQTELFACRDQNIALGSNIAQLTRHKSPNVASEYDTLHAIIGDMFPEPLSRTSPITPPSIHRIESDKESDSNQSDAGQSKGSANEDHVEAMDELRTQLEAELKRAAFCEEQLEQSALVLVSREKEISALIASQLSILGDHEQLRAESAEERAYRNRLQTQVDTVTEANARLVGELAQLKDKYFGAQMASLKKEAELSLGSRSMDSDGDEDEEDGAFKDSLDYASLLPGDFTEALTQKLLLVGSHSILHLHSSCS